MVAEQLLNQAANAQQGPGGGLASFGGDRGVCTHLVTWWRAAEGGLLVPELLQKH